MPSIINGINIVCYDSVTSLMDVAGQLCREHGLRSWDTLLASVQTQGRGQHGRNWISPKGNIHAILVLPNAVPFNTFSASPALAGLMASVLNEMGFDISVKWPNDLLLKNDAGYGKIGGLLLKEVAGTVFAGIGINVASAPEASQLRAEHAFPATRLPLCRTTDLPSLATYWTAIMARMKAKAEFGWASWKESTEARLLYMNQDIEIAEDMDGPAQCTGKVLGLDKNGCLILGTETGTVRCTMGRARRIRHITK